jgi:hypothetical protein
MSNTVSPWPEADAGNDRYTAHIYCLTKLTSSEEETLKLELDSMDDLPELDFVHYRIVPWPNEADGTEADILRIYKQQYTVSRNFHLFVDRQTLHDNTMIVANRDPDVLVFSDDAHAAAQRLVKDMQWDSIDYEIDEDLLYSLYKDFADRAITYARIPVLKFRGVWCNLDIKNVSLCEIVHDLSVVADPTWDAVPFLRKVEEEKRRRDKLEVAQPKQSD